MNVPLAVISRLFGFGVRGLGFRIAGLIPASLGPHLENTRCP